MKYIIKKYFTISIVLTTIALILVNCKRDDLNLQENSSVRDLSYTTKTVKASEIPTIMNFITNRVSKDLKIQIDDSSRNDIIHTKSSEEDITVGEIIVNNIKTVTNSSQKTNYSFKIAKEIPSAPYFFNLIVKESNNGTYAYIVKYEYADSNWVFNGNNLDTFIGKKVFYSPTGKYLAKFDISNGVISNKTFGFPCSDFDGIGSNSGGGGTSYPIDDIGNGTPIYNPTIPSNDSGQGNDSSDSGDSSSAGSSNSSGGNSSDGGSSTEMGVLGSCDQLYVNYDMFEDSDGNPIPITVDCHNVPVVSKSTRLGRLLKSGGIDSNGDCIPDIDDDGYEEPIDNDDENDFEPINIDLGILSQLYALTGQSLNQEQGLWVSDPNNEFQVINIINSLRLNSNSDNINFNMDLIEFLTNNGGEITFDNTLTSSNSLNFNSFTEFQNTINNETIQDFELILDNLTPNKISAKFVFILTPLAKVNVFVEQELSDNGINNNFDDYQITNVVSSESGLTLSFNWTQTSFDYTIGSPESYEATIDIYGELHYNLFIDGIGTVYTEDIHFQVVVNITDGSPISMIKL